MLPSKKFTFVTYFVSFMSMQQKIIGEKVEEPF